MSAPFRRLLYVIAFLSVAPSLSFAQSTSSGAGDGATSQTWQIRAKGTFSLAFNQPGTYDYFCALHPKMTAQIIVK